MTRTYLMEKLPAIVAASLFIIFVLLHLAGAKDLADSAIARWAVYPYPFRFLDTDTVLSAVRCFNEGIDAYAVNPCDDLGRVYTYSPLWMRLLMPLPIDESWIYPVGLLVDIAFLASLFLLPRMRNWRMAIYVSLGAVSSAAVFAVERGNNDLVLYTLVSCTAALAARRPALRYLGYAAALFAGLLKYYPMAVMALALREKPRRFLAIASVSLGVTLLFVLLVWTDLWKAFGNIPVGSWWGNMYGAGVLSGGLAELGGWSDTTATVLRLAMSAIALAVAAFLATRRNTIEAVETLSRREWDFLLVGALITLGCFFTAQNIGYRSVHLLLTVPGLFVAARVGGARFASAPYVALALMWAMGWRAYGVALAEIAIGPDTGYVAFALWLMREGLWWWLIVVLLSLVIAYALRAPILEPVVSRLLAQPVSDVPSAHEKRGRR